MSLRRASRRHAIAAIAAVWVLVLGGLGWATSSSLELDHVRAREAWNQTVDEARALALSRLDGLMAPVLFRESARPYNHFRPYYKLTGAIRVADHLVVAEPVVLESPLRSAAQPDWILLYFQTTETNEPIWSSPQFEGDAARAVSAAVIPPGERKSEASPENWLAALRERYTPSYLINELETAVATRTESRRMLAQASRTGLDGSRPSPQAAPAGSAGTRLSRNAAEFLRRGTRLVQMELEGNLEQCVPETVALENLEVGQHLTSRPESVGCVPVWLTSMTPLWLDLSGDGGRHLAFVRSVVVQGNVFCTLQGLLIDWDRLRETLEAEVRDLFPGARLTPVETSSPVTPGTAHSIMQTIPVRLETGEFAVPPKLGASAALKVGLAVAWAATILALAAIAYGVMKYVMMTERRMRFVAAVTHELRTPLTSFQLYTDLLADAMDSDGGEQRRYVAMLQGESRRLSRLVENVLDYARIEESHPSLNVSKTTPVAILDRLRGGLGERCASCGKELTIENRCRNGFELETDVEVVIQILTNLVENACKYSAGAADPRVWLTTSEAPNGQVAFEVDDAGPGVAPHARRCVFEPFQRGDPTKGATGVAAGLGLGLALSRHWAACLSGQLNLRRSSRGNARYTCFELRLPLAPRP